LFSQIGTNDLEKVSALQADHSFSLLTIRFMPSFIKGTFQLELWGRP